MDGEFKINIVFSQDGEEAEKVIANYLMLSINDKLKYNNSL